VQSQGFAKSHIGERTEAADADLLILEISQGFDRRSGDHSLQELIDAACDQRQIEAFGPSADG
jgi:hypothetical protein